jgi:hypothetical protein
VGKEEGAVLNAWLVPSTSHVIKEDRTSSLSEGGLTVGNSSCEKEGIAFMCTMKALRNGKMLPECASNLERRVISYLLWNTQVGRTQHQHHCYPRSHHTLFPKCHCGRPPHGLPSDFHHSPTLDSIHHNLEKKYKNTLT